MALPAVFGLGHAHPLGRPEHLAVELDPALAPSTQATHSQRPSITRQHHPATPEDGARRRPWRPAWAEGYEVVAASYSCSRRTRAGMPLGHSTARPQTSQTASSG